MEEPRVPHLANIGNNRKSSNHEELKFIIGRKTRELDLCFWPTCRDRNQIYSPTWIDPQIQIKQRDNMSKNTGHQTTVWEVGNKRGEPCSCSAYWESFPAVALGGEEELEWMNWTNRAGVLALRQLDFRGQHTWEEHASQKENVGALQRGPTSIQQRTDQWCVWGNCHPDHPKGSPG